MSERKNITTSVRLRDPSRDRSDDPTIGESDHRKPNIRIRIGFESGRTVEYDTVDNEMSDSTTSRAALPPGVIRSVEGFVLIIDGVHEEACDEDLLDPFGEFGEVKIVDISLNRRTGFTNGYAFVKYDNVKSAENALREMNGTEILGQAITVGWAFSS